MEIIPKKCCIKYDPPTLVLFYELKSNGKLHRRSIPLRDKDEYDQTQIFANLMNETHHSKYLKEFNKNQIKRLIKKVMEESSGLQIDLNSDLNNTGTMLDEKEANLQEKLNIDMKKDDLNKLDDDKLNVVKEHMNGSFEKNQVKPGDDKWQYDIEVDFENNSEGAKIEASPWDDDDESDLEF